VQFSHAFSGEVYDLHSVSPEYFGYTLVLCEACHSMTSTVTPRHRRLESTVSLLRFVLHDISLGEFGVLVHNATSPECRTNRSLWKRIRVTGITDA
jgi:hypothetical protein